MAGMGHQVKNVSLEAYHQKIAAPHHSWTALIDFIIGGQHVMSV